MDNGVNSKMEQRRGIQSIEVGGSLLKVLADAGSPMMLKDLAAAAGMVPAKAHPYLVSYCKLGLVRQDFASGRYALGPFALQMGLAALREVDALRVAGDEVVRLSQEMGQTFAVVVWGSHGPTVVRIEDANCVVQVNMRVGTVLPLLASATGLVFSAYQPGPLVDEALKREALLWGESEVPADLAARLDEVRAHGMARASGSPQPGVNGMAAPVFDSSGRLVLTLTALGPAATFDNEWDSLLSLALKSAAQEVSRQIGYPL